MHVPSPDPNLPSPPSLQQRLLGRLLVPLLLLFCLDGAASYLLSKHYADHVYDSWLYDSASSLALLVGRRDGVPTLDLPPAAARLFVWDLSDTTYYAVTGAHGEFVAGRSDIPPPPADAASFREAQLSDGLIEGQPVRIVTLTLPANGAQQPVRVQVAETRSKRQALARKMLAGVLLPQLALILVAALAVRSGILGGLAPLHMLAQRIEAQDPQRLLPIPADDVPEEILPLTRSLNTLLARLDAAASAQRRFVADAAHQLRTPITALKLNLEQALAERDEQEMRELLRESAHAAQRVAHLSQQLLMLARAEPDAANAVPLERVDLAGLARDVGSDWVEAADAKSIELSLTAPEQPVGVRGNRVLLGEAIANLLDNAVRYHPGNGQIAIHVDSGPHPRVAVLDDGNGIPPAQRGEVLKRFFRLDPARTEGSGLGLSIVNEIVRLHGGQMRFDDGIEGRGISVGFELPAAREPG